jgi:peptidoglycan/xylan/chitin deacetylase (PgdA/CDA1 family)
MNAAAFLERAGRAVQVRAARNIKVGASSSRLDAPIVSFTFDDFPRSALVVGGRMLEEAGWRGTYFAAGGLCGRKVEGLDHFTPDDLAEAHRAGHEIGCHTFSHLRLRGATSAAATADLDRNARFLDQTLPAAPVRSFAYPYGDLDIGKKVLAARRFAVCRGIWPGVNQAVMDFGQLKAVGLEARSAEHLDVDGWLDAAARVNGWLVFFTHDVSDDPSPYGCTRRAFAEVLDKVAARGWRVLPMAAAADLVREGA